MTADLALAALALHATQVLAGLLVWRVLDPGESRWSMRLAAAILVGPAAVALQMFALHAAGIAFTLPALALPWWLVAPWLYRVPAPPRPGLAGALAALALAVPVALAAVTLPVPVHDGDAVNNFALYAKVFGTLGELAPARLLELADAGHVEYPPLVAQNQAWFFILDPDSAPWTVRGFELLACLAFALLVAHHATGAPSRLLGLAVAACVLLAPDVLNYAAGFADLRLAATFLLLGMLALRLRDDLSPRLPYAFAFVLGTGALTKNEGTAVGTAALALLAVLAWRRRGQGSLALLAGFAMLVVWSIVRIRIGLQAVWMVDYLGRDPTIVLRQIPAVVWHWLAVVFGPEHGAWPRWGLAWPALGVLALARARRAREARWFLVALAAHLALYTLVLAASRPEYLRAMLGTAANRLLLHTLPWLLLAAVPAVRSVQPEPGGVGDRADAER